jgi:hypothetical protein
MNRPSKVFRVSKNYWIKGWRTTGTMMVRVSTCHYHWQCVSSRAFVIGRKPTMGFEVPFLLLGFLNIIHVVETMKQNYSGVSRILLDRSTIV